jgi:hypothetical protein
MDVEVSRMHTDDDLWLISAKPNKLTMQFQGSDQGEFSA